MSNKYILQNLLTCSQLCNHEAVPDVLMNITFWQVLHVLQNLSDGTHYIQIYIHTVSFHEKFLLMHVYYYHIFSLLQVLCAFQSLSAHKCDFNLHCLPCVLSGT